MAMPMAASCAVASSQPLTAACICVSQRALAVALCRQVREQHGERGRLASSGKTSFLFSGMYGGKKLSYVNQGSRHSWRYGPTGSGRGMSRQGRLEAYDLWWQKTVSDWPATAQSTSEGKQGPSEDPSESAQPTHCACRRGQRRVRPLLRTPSCAIDLPVWPDVSGGLLPGRDRIPDFAEGLARLAQPTHG